jgi:hypothetical protein
MGSVAIKDERPVSIHDCADLFQSHMLEWQSPDREFTLLVVRLAV